MRTVSLGRGPSGRPYRIRSGRTGLQLARGPQPAQRLVQDGRAVGVAAALLHVGQVSLVRLGARRGRRVLVVPAGRAARTAGSPRARGSRPRTANDGSSRARSRSRRRPARGARSHPARTRPSDPHPPGYHGSRYRRPSPWPPSRPERDEVPTLTSSPVPMMAITQIAPRTSSSGRGSSPPRRSRTGWTGRHRRTGWTGRRRDPVQQDQQHQQHARDDQHDLQGELHPILIPVAAGRARVPAVRRTGAPGCGRSCRARHRLGVTARSPRVSTAAGRPRRCAHSFANSSASRLAPPTSAPSMSGCADDLADVARPSPSRRRAPGPRRRPPSPYFPASACAQRAAHLLRVARAGHPAGADRPDRLVGHHDVAPARRDDLRQRGVSWPVLCSTWLPASRTSSPSPTHRIGRCPCASAARTLRLTSSSSSPWFSRRSECPTTT